MNLLTIPVRTRKDLIRVRQRTRQLAGLVGFTGQDQACLASAVFALACQTVRRAGPITLHFQVEKNIFQVFSGPATANSDSAPAPAMRVQKPLPRDPALAWQDVSWVAQELQRQTPADLFAEFTRQNQ